MLGEFRWNQVHTKLLKMIILSDLIRLGYGGYTGPIVRQDTGEVGKKDESRDVTNIHQELQRTEELSRPGSDSTRLRHLGKASGQGVQGKQNTGSGQ